MTDPTRTKGKQGLASMTPERRREIASMGGRAVQEAGTAHRWTPEKARQAGKKGGQTTSADRGHMAALGRKGGANRSRNRKDP